MSDFHIEHPIYASILHVEKLYQVHLAGSNAIT